MEMDVSEDAGDDVVVFGDARLEGELVVFGMASAREFSFGYDVCGVKLCRSVVDVGEGVERIVAVVGDPGESWAETAVRARARVRVFFHGEARYGYGLRRSTTVDFRVDKVIKFYTGISSRDQSGA